MEIAFVDKDHTTAQHIKNVAQQSQGAAEEMNWLEAGLGLIDTCKFCFRTLEDAETLAVFMAQCFPEPQRVVSGLDALLVNAVEHGNLGLGYAAKSRMLEEGRWREEIEERQAAPEYSERVASVTLARKKDGIYVVIEDQGEGFAWQHYMRVDPARSGDRHGRGIAQANMMSFDRLRYNERGNQAVAFVSHDRTGRFEW